MNKKQKLLFIAFASVILTILAANIIGTPILDFETRLYKKITGKKPQHLVYDKEGVPVVNYEGKVGQQYNVVTIAEQALNWSDSEDSLTISNFYSCINWLMKNGVYINDSSIIYYNYYDWPGYKMTAPWRSAMNQGRAMQVFLKAFEKTDDSLYLKFAHQSMNTLLIPVNKGGVSYFNKDGIWFEEYADDSGKDSRVLNGNIVVLEGLLDYYRETSDTLALFLFNQGVKAVENNIEFYNNNGHSNYDILGKPASSWYHNFHIRLLDYLYKETGKEIFYEYSQIWSAYDEPTYLEKLIQKPTRIRVFSLISILAVFIISLTFLSYFIPGRKS